MHRSSTIANRHFSFSLCDSALHLLICSLAAGFGLGADWPQFLGPQRNGVSGETGLLDSWNAQGPDVAWKKAVGSGYSGPVVSGNRLILFHRFDNSEIVECFNANTGKTEWKYPYPTSYMDDFGKGDGPRSTPAIVENEVYTLGPEGKLHCLEMATGKKIWQRSLVEEYEVKKGFFGISTSPLVDGSLLLLNVGGKDAGIVALSRDSGKEVWRASKDEASYSSPVAATIDGTRLVIFLTRSGLVALESVNGFVHFTKPWRSRFNASVNAASPLVVGNEIFLSASYNTGAILLKIDKEKISDVWKSDDVLSNHYNTSVFHKGYLFGFHGRQEEGAQLRCVEWKSGKVCWTKEQFGCGSIILADGKLIILTEDGDLVLLEADADAYREKSRAHVLARPCRAPIALANGKLYGRDDGNLICWIMTKK